VDSVSGDNSLFGRHLVFTGKLETMERSAAAQEVVNRGGFASDNINGDTNYLVVGSFNAATMQTGGKSNKLKKAEQLAARGQPIEIIGEEDFLRLL
jgi:DNA polymerase III subunit epsilon